MKKDVEIEEMKKKNRPKMYHEFVNEFSAESIEKFRSIGLAQEEDSAFVLALVRSLYENNLNVLSKKTVSGRSKNKTKEPISPAKKSIITNIFNKRLGTNSNSGERKKKLNTLIKTAIGNINKIGH